MFNSPSVEDMKIRPEFEESEEVVYSTGANLGDVVRENVIIAVTTDRLFVREKRGRNVADEHSELADIELELEDIDLIRRTGAVTKEIEIVCGDEIYRLPSLQNGSDELITNIIELEGLGKTDWGEESRAKRGSKQFFAGVIGIIGLLIGGIFTLLGIAGIVSIVGIILGVLWLIGGVVILGGSYRLIVWAFNKEEEWDRSAPVSNSPEIQENESQFVERFLDLLGSSRSKIGELIPTGIWSYIVLLGSLLWLSLFGLLDNESLFGIVLFVSWILLPVAIYLDSVEVKQLGEWRPRGWIYSALSFIPFAASLFGFIWLLRRRQKTGSAFG